jgi:hypothetical protein
MEARRALREFQRLLWRPGALNDVKLLRMNSRLLDSRFEELRASNSITREQESDFTRRIREIKRRLAPRIASPKPRGRPVEPERSQENLTAFIGRL